MPTSSLVARAKPWLAFVLLSAMWGGSFVAIKVVVEYVSPWISAFARMIVAVAALSLFVVIKRVSLRVSRAQHLKIFIAGLFSIGFPFALLFWAEQFIPAGLAGILNGTTPLFTMALILGVRMSRPKTSELKWISIGLITGFLGVAFLFYPKLANEAPPNEFMGIGAGLLMAFCYAVSVLLNKQLLHGSNLGLLANAFYQHLAGLIFLGAMALVFELHKFDLEAFQNLEVLQSIFYLGAIGSALAFILYFYLIRIWGAVRTSAVTYLIPVFAVIFDALIFHHKPDIFSSLGLAFILFGLTLIRRSSRQM